MATATVVARNLVLPPHRSAGDGQFREIPVAEAPDDGVRRSVAWALEHLEEPITLGVLAKQAHVSPRTCLRRFFRSMGTSPMRWLIAQRVRASLALLETSNTTVQQIAAAVGFRSPSSYRLHFTRIMQMSPSSYRHHAVAHGHSAMGQPSPRPRAVRDLSLDSRLAAAGGLSQPRRFVGGMPMTVDANQTATGTGQGVKSTS